MTTKKKKAKEELLKKIEIQNNLPSSIQLRSDERDELAGHVLKMRSPQMREFVIEWMDNGFNAEAAVEVAYPNVSNNSRQISKLMRHPQIKEIIALVRKEIIPSRLPISALKAIQYLENVFEDEKASSKAKVQAAKTLLEHGHGMPIKRVQMETVNWHGNFGKSFLRDKIKEHHRKNLAARGEIIDAEVSGDDNED